MEVKNAVVASDGNPFYLEFWPVVSKLWKTKMGINPVLCYVGNGVDQEPSSKYGEVIEFKPLDDVPLSFQSQWARFFQAAKFEDKVTIVSDIDMLPLSRHYFVHQLVGVPDHLYVHLNPCADTYGHLPACYQVARGHLFKEILEVEDSWPESCRFVFNQKLGMQMALGHLEHRAHWFTDELYVARKISQYRDQRVFCFLHRDGGQNGRRIDRSHWDYDVRLLRQQYYFDAHCPRPYSEFKSIIDPVVNGRSLPFWYRTRVRLGDQVRRVRGYRNRVTN